jgi:ferredoxin-NADP reductase
MNKTDFPRPGLDIDMARHNERRATIRRSPSSVTDKNEKLMPGDVLTVSGKNGGFVLEVAR